MQFEVVPQDAVWVKQAKTNLTAFYENQPLYRMPFEFVAHDITGEFKPVINPQSTPANAISIEEVRRRFFDAERQLKDQLDGIAKRVRDGYWDDTVLALHSIGSCTNWMAEVFGVKTHWFPNRPPMSEPGLTDIKMVDRLKPDFQNSELYQAAIRQMRFFRQVVGDRIPIGAPDLQSPIDIASMVIDYTRLIYAMLDDPRRVHALMRMITDAHIAACRSFRKEMTDYPMTHFDWWMPRGTFVSDDLQAVLNPEFYREFAVPYNEALAQEFGGLAVHSCGRILHNVENLCSTKGLMAFNTQDPLCRIAPIVKNRVGVILGGIRRVVMSTHPDCDRPSYPSGTPEALEDYWFEDCNRLAEIRGQRILYQCHALLGSKRTAREAYELILKVSRKAVENM